MSWSIAITGTKNGVIERLTETKVHGEPEQFEIVRQFLIDEIEKQPAQAVNARQALKGVRVEASGHHDQYGRTLHVEIRTVYDLAIDYDTAIAWKQGSERT